MQNLQGGISLFKPQKEVNAVHFDLSVENLDFISEKHWTQELKLGGTCSAAVGGRHRRVRVFNNLELLLPAFKFRNVVENFLGRRKKMAVAFGK